MGFGDFIKKRYSDIKEDFKEKSEIARQEKEADRYSERLARSEARQVMREEKRRLTIERAKERAARPNLLQKLAARNRSMIEKPSKTKSTAARQKRIDYGQNTRSLASVRLNADYLGGGNSIYNTKPKKPTRWI